MSDFANELRRLCERRAALQEHEPSLLQIDQTVAADPPIGFFEPATLVSSDRGWKAELLSVEAEDLTSWTRHVSSSTWSRMRALEVPILKNFADGNVLAAMVLLRAHLEAAAMGAYCLEQLTDAGKARDFDQLPPLIAKTLFGTSRVKYRNHPEAERLISFGDTFPIRINDALAALDQYFYGEHAADQVQIAYSLLCEFAHPNNGGVRHFVTSTDLPRGWWISYGQQQSLSDAAMDQVLGALIVSMRGGYSAGHLLRCWDFTAEDGGIRWSGPTAEDADRAWSVFLQRKQPLDDD